MDRPLNPPEIDRLRTSRHEQVRRLIATVDALADRATPSYGDAGCERALLACAWGAQDFVMLLRLDAEDFSDPFCRWLYRHLRGLVDDEEPLDLVALLRRVRKPGGLDGLPDGDRQGVVAALGELLTTFAPPTSAEYYFRVLRGERARRAVGRLADALRDRIEHQQHDPFAVLAWAGEQIARLLAKAPGKKPEPATA